LNDRLLRHGSSRSAAPLLAELMGGKLDPSYYLQQLFR
jgi:Zn-dependent M32 family carboxypeptidase